MACASESAGGLASGCQVLVAAAAVPSVAVLPGTLPSGGCRSGDQMVGFTIMEALHVQCVCPGALPSNLVLAGCVLIPAYVATGQDFARESLPASV